MDSNIINQINLRYNRLSQSEKKSLIKKIGYSSLKKAEKTINSLLFSKSIKEWLKKPHYDLVNNSESLLKKLCLELGLLKDLKIKKEIEYNINIIKELKNKKDPYILIKTNFKRVTEPIMVLVILNSKTKIKLSKEKIFELSLEGKEENYIKDIIKENYEKNKGELPIFGKIKEYIYIDLYGREKTYNI